MENISNKVRILLAEDADDQARILTIILTRNGYEVFRAKNGQEAYERINSHGLPDLLITDVMMPIMTGFELLARLKEENKVAPTIVLTGKKGEEDVLRGLGYGASDYISKPYSPSVVLAKVNFLTTKTSTKSQ